MFHTHSWSIDECPSWFFRRAYCSLELCFDANINFIVSFKFLYRNVELVNSANQIENIINSKLYINDDYDFRIDFI